jgi:hypothetical protein
MNLPDILAHPLVENRDEKIATGLGATVCSVTIAGSGTTCKRNSGGIANCRPRLTCEALGTRSTMVLN